MSNQDTCEIYLYDEEKVNHVQELLQSEDIVHAVQLFKALADENRAKIAYALCHEKELCVCDVANIIGSSVATASHHLRMLSRQGIVNHHKDGKMVFYSLKDERIKPLISLALINHKQEGIVNA